MLVLQTTLPGTVLHIYTSQTLINADNYGMVWHGMVNVDLYSAIITKVSNALDTLVSGEKPGFQTLSEGLVVHDNVAYVIYTIDINTPEIRQSVLLRNIHLLYGINTKKTAIYPQC